MLCHVVRGWDRAHVQRASHQPVCGSRQPSFRGGGGQERALELWEDESAANRTVKGAAQNVAKAGIPRH